MELMRKTLAYKICGYLGILLIAFIIISLIIYVNGDGWFQTAFAICGIVLAGLIPITILPMYLILTIMAYNTRQKFTNSQPQILADIGYIFMTTISWLSIFILPWVPESVKILRMS